MTRYVVGVDLGQAQDFTALAVLERTELKGEWDPVAFGWRKTAILRLRHLERVPLGTPYTEVVERVREVVRAPDLLGNCHLVADATGVGRAVIDMLRRASLGCEVIPVMITSGNFEHYEQGHYCVPKRDLIVGLQVMLQRGGLQISSRIPEADELVKEMANMRVRITGNAREQYGDWREGAHDDLALAVAMGCWSARKVWPDVGDAGYWARSG